MIDARPASAVEADDACDSPIPADHLTTSVPADDPCDFCSRLNGSMEDRPWYDFHVLHRTSRFNIVVALGALVPGHVMVVSNDHVERMADLADEGILELEALTHEWVERLTKQWKDPCFLFEHAGRTQDGGRGGCITHAHLQLLPLSFQIARDLTYRQTTSLHEALQTVGNWDYLLVSHDSGWAVTTEYRASGQYLRRQISTALGTPDEWDYLVYPRHDVMRETIYRLSPPAAMAPPSEEVKTAGELM